MGRTVLTDKWTIGGEGKLRDLFVAPAIVKLALDLVYFLFVKATKWTIILIALLYGFITSILRYDSLITHIVIALTYGFLAALVISITIAITKNAKYLINAFRLHRIEGAYVPLDKSLNPNTAIKLDRSILIAGESGSGKSNVIWLVIEGLNKYEIPYKLHVIDPAGGVELSDLQHSPNTLSYADRAAQSDEVILHMHEEMNKRLINMKKLGIRKHPITTQEPLHILIIDELLLLKTVRQDPTTPLGEILAVGRKAAFIVIAATQLSQIDAIGRIRDLFPQRICMATTSQEMTDAVLGNSATKSGARAHLIRSPGQGYVYLDGKRGFHRFQSPEILNTIQIASPLQSRPSSNDQRPSIDTQRQQKTAVYKLYSNEDPPTLMYVGISNNPNRRFEEHKDSQVWWPFVDLAKTEIEWYPDRSAALQRETQLIRSENPVYNVVGRATM